MDRSEKLIECGDSWFSPKCIEVQPRVWKVSGVEHWMDEGDWGPTDFNQTPNTGTGYTGVRLRVRRFVVERETALTDS